ncbi:glycosyltransferase family 4 protein [Pedobacter polaris]|uniref:Glycosyltransferase family 4 protein n=1 Tax=Pedobacter polaris TaxID=2571273 RepID=A0A4V5P0B3_9SPHI|nr:glycosyltransferase family 4 protein [Pedobacter polaris]TKC13072.1 glycosyltransferase family 4 protein [Pedobacter polaris]
MQRKKRILVLGQTPPPYGGQALMLQTLLNGEYKNADLFHVRLEFSRDFDDMGSFKLYKFWSLFKAIVLTWVYRFYYGANILYYGPAGPNKLGMYRDILLLAPIRFIFKKTIIHTHAGGSSRLYQDLNPIAKLIYRIAFFKPDVLITLTGYSHGDEVVMKAKELFVVPNGIKDEYPLYVEKFGNQRNQKLNLVYVGAMYEERGIIELVEAVHLLKQKNIDFCLQLVGIFIDTSFKEQIDLLIKNYGLDSDIIFLGTKINEEKWKIFSEADIFCFPTRVPSETFGIVLIEAMQFKVPIIAARWNGIPFVVDDQKNGLLVNPNDATDLAAKLELLINNEALRIEIGNNGRKKFEENYSIDTFLKNMDSVFSKV